MADPIADWQAEHIKLCRLFALLQNQIDRRDPKLDSAPVGAEPELDFGPARGSSGTLGKPLGGAPA